MLVGQAALAQVVLADPLERAVFVALGACFWPGGLTLVAPMANHLPRCLSAGTGKVGVRVPNHPVALALLKACGVPVAAPSANRFGHVSPTSVRKGRACASRVNENKVAREGGEGRVRFVAQSIGFSALFKGCSKCFISL